MNKEPDRKQLILHNELFDQESIQITHSITFINEKKKITQKEVQKVLKNRGMAYRRAKLKFS